MKIVTTNGSEQIDFGKQATFEADFPVLGTTAQVHLRTTLLEITPGASAGTNINITVGGSEHLFNSPTITNVTDLAKDEVDGNFTLTADGLDITLDTTETVTGIIAAWVTVSDINSSSSTEVYIPFVRTNSGNIRLSLLLTGQTSRSDWTTIMDAGDLAHLVVTYVTST